MGEKQIADARYIAPNRKAQIAALVFLVLVLCEAIFGPSINALVDRMKPSSSATLEEMQVATDRMLTLALIFVGIGALLSMSLTFYFARQCYRTFKYREYPPPDTLVVFRTRIQSGRKAIACGCGLVLLATGFAFWVLVSAYGIWLLTESSYDSHRYKPAASCRPAGSKI